MRQPAATRKFFTTSEAAALLKVSVATLKRWAQAGLVTSERTEGGHRRFPRAALEALARPAAEPGPAAALADELARADSVVELTAIATRGRRQAGSWAAFGDALRPSIIELHRRRQAGSLTTVQWLAALERLRHAFVVLADPPAAPGTRPSLVLAVAPGDRVQHGAALARLVALEAGWAVRPAGAAQPQELVAELERERADALLVNASADADPQLLAHLARELATSAAAARVPLALAGLGSWPEPLGGAARLHAFDELRAWLDGLRTSAGAVAAAPIVVEPPESPLDWDPSLALGDAAIDAQHRRLFATVRGFVDAVREGAGADEVDRLLGFAQDYVAVHFRSEEHLMRSRGYPYLEEHVWEHEQFVRRLDAEAAERAAPGAAEKLGELLADWLRQHVRGSDRRMGAWLQAHGSAR